MDLMEIKDLMKMRNITNSIFRPESKFIDMMNPRIDGNASGLFQNQYE